MKGLRRGTGKSKDGVENQITAVLAEVTPLLRIDHCTLEIEEFVESSGSLTVRIDGSCPDCLGSPAMFATAIEAHVKQRIPQVRRVIISA